MSDKPIGDNIQDFGTTIQITGTVGLASTAVPSVVGDFITTVLIRNPQQSPTTLLLYYSFDNITFMTLSVGEFIGWSVKGNKTQIY